MYTAVCVYLTRIYRKYPEVLSTLFSVLDIESDRRCIDNICAAVCRMTTAHADAVPVAQVGLWRLLGSTKIMVVRC